MIKNRFSFRMLELFVLSVILFGGNRDVLPNVKCDLLSLNPLCSSPNAELSSVTDSRTGLMMASETGLTDLTHD